MRMECSAAPGDFQAVSGRAVVADFDGGSMTSDAGALLLGQADAAVGLAACFADHRDGRFVEHSVRTLVGRRVLGIALGYEDSINHDVLRGGPVMAVLAGKLRAKRRNCAPVAGKSTPSRLELGGSSPSGDGKIVHDGSAIADVLAEAKRTAREAPRRRGASRTSCGPRATVGAASAASSARRNGPTARPTRASSSPRSPPARTTPGASTRPFQNESITFSVLSPHPVCTVSASANGS